MGIFPCQRYGNGNSLQPLNPEAPGQAYEIPLRCMLFIFPSTEICTHQKKHSYLMRFWCSLKQDINCNKQQRPAALGNDSRCWAPRHTGGDKGWSPHGCCPVWVAKEWLHCVHSKPVHKTRKPCSSLNTFLYLPLSQLQTSCASKSSQQQPGIFWTQGQKYLVCR